MVDPLSTVTADLESRHLDDAGTICSVAPKTIPDDTWVFCPMPLARVREEHAHAQEYLTGVQNPDVPHLHVEIHGRISSTIDSEPFSEAEMMFLDGVALNAEQSRKGRVWIADVPHAKPTARFQSSERAPANVRCTK